MILLRKYLKFVFLAGVVLILSGVGVFIISDQNEKNMKDKENSEKIVASFGAFSESATVFSNKRLEVYDTIFQDVILEDYASNKESYDDLFNTYMETLQNMDEAGKDLKELCPNHTYKDSDVVSKCSSYMTAYETSVNYFIKDVNLYNDQIELYNKTASEPIALYQSDIYSDYIDFNGDGAYLGKD